MLSNMRLILLSDMLHPNAGIDDPYEAPEHPEITLDVNDPQGRRQTPEAMARIILAYLEVQPCPYVMCWGPCSFPRNCVHSPCKLPHLELFSL